MKKTKATTAIATTISKTTTTNTIQHRHRHRHRHRHQQLPSCGFYEDDSFHRCPITECHAVWVWYKILICKSG